MPTMMKENGSTKAFIGARGQLVHLLVELLEADLQWSFDRVLPESSVTPNPQSPLV